MFSLLRQFGHFITSQGKESKKGKLREKLDLLSHGNKVLVGAKPGEMGCFPGRWERLGKEVKHMGQGLGLQGHKFAQT